MLVPWRIIIVFTSPVEVVCFLFKDVIETCSSKSLPMVRDFRYPQLGHMSGPWLQVSMDKITPP